ncbi:hypothetical protein GALL_452970 [mine drainage metagenome]|uniref:Uncharacterized protein n=1 Tax=mine drainage metagenome TaxID=410659 RepID=A0A1J5Q6I8_9ZZZZ
MGKAEDVVDEEQNVSTRLVAELLGQRQTRQGDAQTRTRRLVHLTVNKGHFRLRQVVDLDNAGFDHLVVKVVAFTGPLAHTGENRVARVHFGDVVDQFHDQNRLAHACAAEEADLATFGVGCQQVDNLDAGHEDFRAGRLFSERRGRAVDRAGFGRVDRALFVNRLADDVQNTA